MNYIISYQYQRWRSLATRHIGQIHSPTLGLVCWDPGFLCSGDVLVHWHPCCIFTSRSGESLLSVATTRGACFTAGAQLLNSPCAYSTAALPVLLQVRSPYFIHHADCTSPNCQCHCECPEKCSHQATEGGPISCTGQDCHCEVSVRQRYRCHPTFHGSVGRRLFGCQP